MKSIKIMLIALCVNILIGCSLFSSDKWELLKTFKAVNSVTEVNEMTIGFLNDKTGFAVYRNNIYLTADGGSTWNEKKLEVNPCLSGLELLDEKNIVIGCQCSNIKYTVNGLDAWNDMDEKNYSLFSFYNVNSGIIYTASGIKDIKMIKNSKTVGEIKLPEEYKNASVASISSINANESYILLAGTGPLLRTSDGGKTWEKVNFHKIADKLSLQAGVTSMKFTDKNNGIIVTYFSDTKSWISLTTKNGGKSWTYSEILKTKTGWHSYLSADGNYVTIQTMADRDYPIALIKRKK